jgi:hypothetical protein
MGEVVVFEVTDEPLPEGVEWVDPKGEAWVFWNNESERWEVIQGGD